jgi:hypothetical protein
MPLPPCGMVIDPISTEGRGGGPATISIWPVWASKKAPKRPLRAI